MLSKQFLSFFSHKKSQEGMSFNALIGGILAFISIVALVYLVIMLIGIFSTSNQNVDSTINNYKELTRIVDNMLNDKAESLYFERLPLYVSSGYQIIGFDRFQDYVFDQANIKIYKPNSCKNKACICLYNGIPISNDGSTRDQGVIKCTIYNKPVKFFSKGRAYERGHPDTFGLERNDIAFPNAPRNNEYFDIAGDIFQPLLGVLKVHTYWMIRNVELTKTVYDNTIFMEISAVPDAELLRKEMTLDAAYVLLDQFLGTSLPQTVDELTIDPIIGGSEAKKFLEDHPELYQNKNYREFIVALYSVSGTNDVKNNVFKTVSYSTFHNQLPLDKNYEPIQSEILADYPPLKENEYDYTAQLTDLPPNVDNNWLASEQVELNPNENATISFYLADIGDFAERYRPGSSDAGAAWQ